MEGVAANIVERKYSGYRVNIIYPEVDGLKNQTAENKINQKIQNQIYSLILEQGYEINQQKEFNVNYTVGVNEKDILSITTDVYSYETEIAHGLTVRKSVNADLQNGQIFALKELFSDNNNYISIINDIIKHEFINKDIPTTADFESIKEDQDYYLSEDSIVIYFQINEYTPYNYGFPEFRIPYGALTDIISENSPIVKLIS